MDVLIPVIANWQPCMRACLEAIDPVTGTVDPILSANLPLQAPNWTPDGKALIVNAAGSLYRVDLDDPKHRLQPIVVAGLHSINNDHGLSPDGELLALTDKTEFGRSAIYVLPLRGGAPRLLVRDTPAWFHGWSPDGRQIVYTCVRNGLWAIAACVVETGREQVLIRAAPSTDTHYDSPDFTPDGAWIWFNSDRDGSMALWRMRPDGSAPERMTHGAGADWFPHPSPDGQRICYLSYAAGVRGHPFGREVSLQVMPAEGGPSRRLARIFGGQGTLNVPCWSPDGQRFAYMRFDVPPIAVPAPRLRHAVRRVVPMGDRLFHAAPRDED